MLVDAVQWGWVGGAVVVECVAFNFISRHTGMISMTCMPSVILIGCSPRLPLGYIGMSLLACYVSRECELW